MQMLSAVALIGLLAPGAVAGDDIPADPLTAAVGQRVRLSPGGRATMPNAGGTRDLVGTLSSYDGSQLTINVEGVDKPVVVAFDDIRRFEVARGRRSLVKDGAAIGGTVGALLGLGLALLCYETCGDSDEGTGAKGAIVIPVVVGAAGAAAGALVAAPFHADRWERIALPARTSRRISLSLHPVPRGAAAHVTLGF